MERVVTNWNGLPSLEVLKISVDMAVDDMV